MNRYKYRTQFMGPQDINRPISLNCIAARLSLPIRLRYGVHYRVMLSKEPLKSELETLQNKYKDFI